MVAADPLALRGDAPLLDAYLAYLEAPGTPFCIPGHKQRADLFGRVVEGDAPMYGAVDTMKVAHGTLAAAEARAAELWGADLCRFSVGGSTHGNQALALALGEPGDKVVVSRTLHRSMLLGLALAGLEPVWVRPTVDPETGLPGGVPSEHVRAALEQHPGARAVLIGDPSYVGTLSDVSGLAAVAHAHDIPLVVDAAWAAHFGFHPALPSHALARGADAMVTSAHKTLPAYTQAALMFAQTRRLDPARLDAAFEATHTTSPAGSILASIDASRALLARDGPELIGRMLALVRAAQQRLSQVPGLVVVRGEGMDPAKLVLLLAGTGADGTRVELDLIGAGMPVEMADRDTLIPMVTLADDASTLAPFVDTLVSSIERHRGEPRRVVGSTAWTVDPEVVMPPRDAFFAPHEAVPVKQAAGRVCAELVAPYPPGIPVLAPGERVTSAVLDALLLARSTGVRIAYAADPTLQSVRVVKRLLR
jgi:lysine decarboxylase